MKRSTLSDVHFTKKQKHETESSHLNSFVDWSKSSLIVCSEKNHYPRDFSLFPTRCSSITVRVSLGESCAKYGMMAVTDINQGESLFTIPREILLFADTSAIWPLLKKEQSKLDSSSGWVPSLLALMYEYSCPHSKWKPYMEILPKFEELNLPMFWDGELRKTELQGTGLLESVDKDLSSMQQEFFDIVLPFVKSHPDVFPDRLCSQFEFYKHMVAIVMSYSFTEPPAMASSDEDSDTESEQLSKSTSVPMMVPMADILNHISKNNAHLDFGPESLNMVAIKDIKKGEEIFNTYGELGNSELLHMYGFTEKYPDNKFDTVDISLTGLEDLLEDSDLQYDCMKEKLNILRKNSIITPESPIVLGEDGILTEDIMIEILQVLDMTKEELDLYDENDGFRDCESESLSLDADSIESLPTKWKTILGKLAENALLQYRCKTTEIEEKLLLPEVWNTLNPMQQFAANLRHGQKKLLWKFYCLCKDGR